MKIWERPYFYPMMIFIIGLIVWSGAFFAPYQFDDYVTPLQDPASRSLEAFFENFFHTLRPFTKLTYALESSLGLTEAYQRRFFQFSLMLISSWFMFELLKRRLQNAFISFIITLIWVSHPIHAETFISLAGRPTLLAMVFVLASLLESNIVLSFIYALMASLCKEVAIPFLVYQSIMLIQTKKIKVGYLVSGVMVLSLFLLRLRLLELIKFSLQEAQYYIHWWDGIAAISAGFLNYFLPWKISVDPDFLFFNSALWFFISIVFICGLLFWAKKSKSEWVKKDLFLWAVLMLPTHSLILKLDPLGLRSFSYSSIIIPFLILDFIGSLKDVRKISVALLPILIITIFSTINFSRTYRDPITLWAHAKRNSPHKLRPVVNLSFFLVREDRYVEAKEVLEEGLKVWPNKIIIQERLEAINTLIENEQLINQGK